MWKNWHRIALTKNHIWGNPRVIVYWALKRSKGAECAQLVGIGTRRTEMAYFDVDTVDIEVSDLAEPAK